jgi:hypothetical protein
MERCRTALGKETSTNRFLSMYGSTQKNEATDGMKRELTNEKESLYSMKIVIVIFMKGELS